MKKAHYTFFLLFTIILVSCKFECQVGNQDDKAETKDSTNNVSTNKIESTPKTLNGIELSAKDVQVNRAFLSLESGDLVPSDNTVALGEKISLMINIDNGWKEENGKSFIGASEIITTDNGTELLNTGDMFAAYDATGLDATDAKVITLKARITSESPGTQYYLVNFKVWDKKGTGEITGQYKFYIKK